MYMLEQAKMNIDLHAKECEEMRQVREPQTEKERKRVREGMGA